MARTLNTFVTVHRRDDKGELTGESGTFGPGDDLSKPENTWVEKAISNPDVWADGDTAADQDEPARPAKPAPPAKSTSR